MPRALLLALLLWLVAPSAAAAPATRQLTPRGAAIEVLLDKPTGPGPFPVVVLGSGAGYHMRLPLLEQVARGLAAAGIGVYRFDWAYYVADPTHGRQSEDRAAASASPLPRLALLSGNHVFERGPTPEKTPGPSTRRTLELVGALAADFITSLATPPAR